MTTDMIERARAKTLDMIKERAAAIPAAKTVEDAKVLIGVINILVKDIEQMDKALEENEQPRFRGVGFEYETGRRF